MKKFTLFLSVLLISTMSFAAKITATVTASANAGYTKGAALIITGLSAPEVNYNALTLEVSNWEAPGGTLEGYAAVLKYEGEETASCDGLMVSQDTLGTITISGKMLGYPHDYIFDNLQVSPKQAATIPVVCNNMTIETDFWEKNDLVLKASTDDYSIEITLYGGLTKLYGTYDASNLFATINTSAVDMKENTTATFSLEGDLAKFEASYVYGIDTLQLTLTGEPYADPATIVPTDTAAYILTKTHIGKMSGFNTVYDKDEEIEIKIQVPNGNWLEGVTKDDFSYGSYVKVDGKQLEILRGNLKVVENGTTKTATIGILCSDKVWYNIIATTAEQYTTAVENIVTTAATTKQLKNGKLIIIRNKQTYNAAGAIIQ